MFVSQKKSGVRKFVSKRKFERTEQTVPLLLDTLKKKKDMLLQKYSNFLCITGRISRKTVGRM